MEFTKDKGYDEIDLIQFGLDNIRSAFWLFKGSPGYYHSAGYLIHLGIELILKAWVLHRDGKFTNEHSLTKLYESLKPHLSFQQEEEDYLKHLQKFYTLRYPRERHPIEIGDEDRIKVVTLLDSISKQMPKVLNQMILSIDNTKKGNMRLMVKNP